MTNFDDPNFNFGNGRPVIAHTNNVDYSNNSINSIQSVGQWSTTNSQCGMTASTKSLHF